MGLGLIISSRTTSPTVMVVSVGVLLGLASTSITTNTAPTAAKWFPANRKGLIIGLVTMGMGVSSLYMAPLINTLLASVGIQSTFLYLCIAALIIVCGLGLAVPVSPAAKELIARKKSGMQRTPEEIAAAEEAARKMDEEDADTLYQNKLGANVAIKTKEFFVIFFIYAAMWMPGQMVTSAVANICVVQANWENGYIAVMAMAVGNGPGRLCSAALSDKLGVVKTYRALFIIQCINLLLFAMYRSPAPLFFGVVVLGLCIGSGVPMKIALVAQVFGRRYMASIGGTIDIAFGIAGFGGPVIAAAILQSTGSYNMSYLLNAVIMVIGFGLTFMIATKKKEPASLV